MSKARRPAQPDQGEDLLGSAATPTGDGQDEQAHLDSTSLTADTGLTHRRLRALPAKPTMRGRPTVCYGPTNQGSGSVPPTRDQDPVLWAVADELTRLDPAGDRCALVLREAFDQIYDGGRTGRWDFSQLMKTEKTHIGTLVEIWLQREFRFPGGDDLDFKIEGVEVDAKWSRNLYGWEIPLEMYSSVNQVALRGLGERVHSCLGGRSDSYLRGSTTAGR